MWEALVSNLREFRVCLATKTKQTSRVGIDFVFLCFTKQALCFNFDAVPVDTVELG